MPRGIPNNRIAQSERIENPPVDETAQSPRAVKERRERRRRDDGDLDRMGRMALSIPPEVQERLDREGKVARWVRDAAGRQAAMHRDDWDVTPGVDAVPESRDGEGKLVLMEKYRDWYDDDQRKKNRILDERDRALERGDKINPDDQRQAAVSYTPPGNRLSRKAGL